MPTTAPRTSKISDRTKLERASNRVHLHAAPTEPFHRCVDHFWVAGEFESHQSDFRGDVGTANVEYQIVLANHFAQQRLSHLPGLKSKPIPVRLFLALCFCFPTHARLHVTILGRNVSESFSGFLESAKTRATMKLLLSQVPTVRRLTTSRKDSSASPRAKRRPIPCRYGR